MPNSPPPRKTFPMDFDPCTGQIILFGGISGGGVLGDTWALTLSFFPQIISANTTTFPVGTFSTFTIITTGSPTPSITEMGMLPLA